MNNKKIIPILIVLTIIFTIFGATFAYWSWNSDNANKTNITFTIGADFSCGANGGGNIASSNIAPASCTNSAYAIQREITTTITNSGSSPVSMDMWLTVNSIDQALANSANFKWALTTDSTTCSSNVINQGTFQGKTVNSTVTILSGSTASTATYYLYIWLDSVETSTTTMNQSYSFSLGGACTNEVPSEQTVYTANLYDRNVEGWNSVWIGEAIPDTNTITVYHDPNGASAAMSALKTASGGTTDRPFFLMHKLDGSGTVTESYVGFVITSSMVTAATSSYTTRCNSSYTQMGYSNATECINAYNGATAGTYTIRGDNLWYYDSSEDDWFCRPENIDSGTGDCINTSYYSSNTAILTNAFGSSNCTDYSSYFYCDVPGLYAIAYQYGYVRANDGAWNCGVGSDGSSSCYE